MTYVLGITGRKRSGKNTAGEVFAQAGFKELSFAAPIKLMLATLLEYRGAGKKLIQRMLEGDLKEEPTHLLGGRSPRYAMQTLGTEWGRMLLDDNLWVEALFDASKRHQCVVVTDVRFPNEAGAIKACGGQVMRVVRPDNPLPADAHPSEAQIDQLPVDFELVNDASSAEGFQSLVAAMFFTDAVGEA